MPFEWELVNEDTVTPVEYVTALEEGEPIDPDVEVFRAKVPGGWLIMVQEEVARAITFYPDPGHEWDGSTLPCEGDEEETSDQL